MNALLRGKAHVYGDNIDTDRIIPGKYTKTLDLSLLAEHVLEDLDPDFHRRVRPGDIVAAGENFGCGSSREQAPLALKAAGVSAVVAESFARIFYRNAINVGLPLIEVRGLELHHGSELEIDLVAATVSDNRTGKLYQAIKLPEVMLAILQAGGLVDYLKQGGDYGRNA